MEINTRAPQTEKEYIAANQVEVARLKYQTNTIAIGVVVGIQQVKSNFNPSFKITMDSQIYWYNSNIKDVAAAEAVVHKMLPIGKKAAFSFKTKVNGNYKNFIIENIYYTFSD